MDADELGLDPTVSPPNYLSSIAQYPQVCRQLSGIDENATVLLSMDPERAAGFISALDIQAEGKKRMTITEFLKGFRTTAD